MLEELKKADNTSNKRRKQMKSISDVLFVGYGSHSSFANS
jgi:hypothetical protein